MITIADIAKSLGVTPSTVSRSLSGSPRVKESTREAVLRKAEELGYRRNAMASTLRSGKVKIVGMVVPRINREFFSNVISGTESVLEEYGYSVFICQTREEYEKEISALRTLMSNRVAGVIISHAINDPDGSHISEILDPGTVLVQFDRVFPELSGAKIVNDNFRGAYEATRHLISMGYKKIGTLAGVLSTGLYRQRLAGYRAALEESGLDYSDGLVFKGSILRGEGRESALAAINAGCDALYCSGDFLALGAMDAAYERELKVPDEFGIVGTADEKFTSLMSPSLSSLAQRPQEIGRKAAEAFISAVKSGDALSEVVVPMELMIRESSLKTR